MRTEGVGRNGYSQSENWQHYDAPSQAETIDRKAFGSEMAQQPAHGSHHADAASLHGGGHQNRCGTGSQQGNTLHQSASEVRQSSYQTGFSSHSTFSFSQSVQASSASGQFSFDQFFSTSGGSSSGGQPDFGGQFPFSGSSQFASQLQTVFSGVINFNRGGDHVTGGPYTGGPTKPTPGPEKPTTPTGKNDIDKPLKRLVEADYGDGKSSPSGADRPNPREISNTVSAAEHPKDNKAGATDLFWGWGQFVDHDLSLSKTSQDEPLPIDIPKGDPRFDPESTGDKQLAFNRSEGELDAKGVRQQKNAITPLMDGSNVYGSTADEQAALRSGAGGKLTMGPDNNLPRNERGGFKAGDERVNENPVLTSLHTVFAREHNRIADGLSQKYPNWSDDQIYTGAREQNVAQMQAITNNEFLPTLLGKGADGPGPLGHNQGYTGVDPQISNEFSAGAYRFGHSLVNDKLKLVDENGKQSEVALDQAFFNPQVINANGVDDVLRGAASQQAQALDPEIVDPLRNNVIPGPEAMPLDLASLNIQRGRDHGLPGLNDVKRGLGQQPLTGFDDPRLQDGVGEKLAKVYDSIEDVDLWVGALAEKPVNGGMSGETQSAILTEQFQRTRNGDPNWYETKYSPYAVEKLNRTTLSDIIERNTKDVDLQRHAMLMRYGQYS